MNSHLESIPRRSQQKSRAGCQNCKKRKVKCDERHPLCYNCERHYPNILQCFDDQLEAPSTQNTPVTVGVVPRNRQFSQNRTPDNAHTSSGGGVLLMQPQLPGVIGGGQLDPFETYPASSVPDVDILLKHYLSALVLQSFPFFHTGAIVELWWPFLRTDNVLFHIVLHLSARNLESIQRQPDRNRSRLAKGEALRLLNQTLERVSEVSDQTIVAVANFMTIEHEDGNMRTLKTHLKGLKRMVKMRGGLDTVGSRNPMAANIVFWMSMVATNGPQFLPTKFGSLIREQHYQTVERFVFERVEAEEKLIDTLLEVNLLTKQFSINFNSTSANEGLLMLSRLSSVLQHLLSPPPSAINNGPGIAGLSESCRYAGALHVLYPLMANYPDPTLMVHALVHKLKASLITFDPFFEFWNPVLLWCLAVGAVSALQMPERNWFVGHIGVGAADLNIKSWDEMRICLTGVMSYAIFCDDSFRSVWDAVVAKADI